MEGFYVILFFLVVTGALISLFLELVGEAEYKKKIMKEHMRIMEYHKYMEMRERGERNL